MTEVGAVVHRINSKALVRRDWALAATFWIARQSTRDSRNRVKSFTQRQLFGIKRGGERRAFLSERFWSQFQTGICENEKYPTRDRFEHAEAKRPTDRQVKDLGPSFRQFTVSSCPEHPNAYAIERKSDHS